MTDKEKLEEIKKLADAMYYAAQHLTTDASRLHKAMIEYHKFIIHKYREEPVSEDLKEAAEKYAYELCPSIGVANTEAEQSFKAGAQWQKEQFVKNRLAACDKQTEEEAEIERDFVMGIIEKEHRQPAFDDAIKYGMERMKQQMMKNIWKPADGDDLPEIDREVIALLDNGKVVFAHRPNPNGWNGTNIDTEEKEHFEPVIYDKGGWNQPHVLYWLDAKLPYEENKIIK